jgi:large subunit ribosomal protein L17
MRHRVAHRKLGRTTEHRIALLRNQATALLRHERIETTVPKAKELRPFVERLISIAKRSQAGETAPVRSLHARRIVLQDVEDRAVVSKLFDTIAPRFASRPGGYTRLLRLGFRRGDGAEVAQVELIGSEYDPNKAEEPAEKAAPKRKGFGGRIREAAGRLRGEPKPADREAAEGETEAAPARTAATRGKRSPVRGRAVPKAKPGTKAESSQKRTRKKSG